MARKPKNSEVDAYVFIDQELRTLGWDIRNPERVPTGQVWTQNEALSNAEIGPALELDRPESIVKVSESVVWVIEAKREHRQLTLAVAEAEEYAQKINTSRNIKALIISGIAGNQEDSYLIETRFFTGESFEPVTFNGRAVSSLLSPEIAQSVLQHGPDLKDPPIDEALFLTKAERINQILHLGAINKNYRARVMAALLLSLVEETRPNVDAPPSVLIEEINSRARRVLSMQGKAEFFQYISIALPVSEDNHVKFKAALVQTLQELNNLNIRSAMNSGTDVLGKFYEVFLKYGNGAKEIGIVLTPRHITEFVADTLSVSATDIIFDPTCGTGGFLVAGLDHVKRHYGEVQVNQFKQNNVFGVDQEAEVVALAMVNMIFRGDGKNNIVEGNCFQKHLVRATDQHVPTARYSKAPPSESQQAVTRVLMNPPFALKRSDEKEFRFVDHALSQMQDGGLLFSVLPYSAMVRSEAYLRWRKNFLLRNHSLLSVITLPPDLFYPVGVHTVGIYVRKGTPHSEAQRVLWVRATNDGLLKIKGKRLPNPRASNDYIAIRSTVKAFIQDQSLAVTTVDRHIKATPIDFTDPHLELVPENYLDDAPPPMSDIIAGMEEVIRETMAHQFREGLQHDSLIR